MESIQSKILLVVISGLLVMTVAVVSISFYTTNNILHKDADIILKNPCQKEAAQIKIYWEISANL